MDRIEMNRILNEFEKHPRLTEGNIKALAVVFCEKDGKRMAGETWITDLKNLPRIIENFGRQVSEDELEAKAIMVMEEKDLAIMNRQGEIVIKGRERNDLGYFWKGYYNI